MIDMNMLMRAISDEDRDSVQSMLDSMSDDDKRYMYGYMQGFTDALRMASDSEHDMTGFTIGSDSDRIAT